MYNYNALQHVFLIAMPKLIDDPYFTQSVVYLWEYNEEGATGIIINKPLDSNLGELLRQLQIEVNDPQIEDYPVFRGGPIAADRGFIIRRRHKIDEQSGNSMVEITVSSSKEDLVDLANGKGLGDIIVALGCAGWGAGQLDQELANNDWLIVPFSEFTLFGLQSEDETDGGNDSVITWHNAAARAGIDLSRLSSDVGHA